MIRLFEIFDAFDKAINEGIDNAIAHTRKTKDILDKVKDNGDNYSVKIDIPGFEREEIDIDIGYTSSTLSVLNIKAKNAENSKSFTFYVPKDIDKDTISASLKNGQLTITLPKMTNPTRTKRIRVT
jgi:HSP20 family protein